MRRWHEHIHDDTHPSVIHSAIKKYGEKNFSFQILEANIPNYNERKRYWIAYYQSNNKNYGYNRTDGGEDPPTLSDESSRWCVFSDAIIHDIQQALIDNRLSFEEISQQYDIAYEYLTPLNIGKARRNPSLQYPLRKNGNERTNKEKVGEVAHL